MKICKKKKTIMPFHRNRSIKIYEFFFIQFQTKIVNSVKFICEVFHFKQNLCVT